MKSVGEGKLELTRDLLDPIFTCLDCRACTTDLPGRCSMSVGSLNKCAASSARRFRSPVGRRLSATFS
ncbi:hypothetical protein DI43_06685 [Geobacillus sp. CAMR12739]|nr:hypothetical protein DI43_06685 [Geobacillus sp. CAMR12739]